MLKTVLVGFLPTGVPFPDVVLVVVVVIGFRYSLALGGGFSFLLGLLQDVLAGGIIGLNALSKTLVFSLTKLMSRRFYFPNFISKIAMVLLGGVIDSLLLVIVLFIAGLIHTPFPILLRHLLVQIFCTALLAPVVIMITMKILVVGDRGEEGI